MPSRRRYTFFMGDNGGSRHPWWRKWMKPDEGDGTDAERRPESLIDLVAQKRDESLYIELGGRFPEQLLQLQVLYSASQRAFEAGTRKALRLTIGCVLRTVLRDPRLAESPANKHVGDYLDEEIIGLKARLGQDRAVAMSRGLNFGLAVGALISTALLCLPLLWGTRILEGLAGVRLSCPDRWSLMGAFVCGGVGAFGAVLSVLMRLRNSGDELTRRKVNGHEGAIAPGELYRNMRHEGVYRVFVGWVLALAVHFLLTAGFVTFIDLPATPADICSANDASGAGTDFWGFWCAVGFVAGFNERWAYGLLGRESTSKKNRP
ncbi:hypothetical protein Sipo7851_13970 [Streptomyces ipomoeae]|nr:hypothetical protein Sipo7851_13970 [Streptomyces ipomoeae]